MRRFFDIDRLTEIWEALSRNRSRSLLTGFGVFWGIFMLLSLMGGGQGLKTMLTDVLSGACSDTFQHLLYSCREFVVFSVIYVSFADPFRSIFSI